MIVRLIDISMAFPRYRQVRLPTVAAGIGRYVEVKIKDENIEPVAFSPAGMLRKWIFPLFLSAVVVFMLTAPWSFSATDRILW